MAQAAQQVLDLVQGLNRSRRVVDRRRQRANRDVDQQSDRVLGVLLECAFVSRRKRPAQGRFGDFRFCAVDAQHGGAFDQRVADGRGHDHHALCGACPRQQGVDVDRLNDAWGAFVPQALGDVHSQEVKWRFVGIALIFQRIDFPDAVSSLVAGERKHAVDLQQR